MNKELENWGQSRLGKLWNYKDIIWFLMLFLFFEFCWKLAVHQGDEESTLLVFGRDLTHYTHSFNLFTAQLTHWVVTNLFGYSDFQIDDATIFFEGSLRVDIIWGCTGLKQLFMFTFIMLFYFGPKTKKYWFIPLSLVILTLVNILRLSIICIIIKDPFPEWFIGMNEWYNNRTWINTPETYWQFYTDWFNVFHRDAFTWIYYDGVIFVLWLTWEEVINRPYQRLKGVQKTEKTEAVQKDNLPTT